MTFELSHVTKSFGSFTALDDVSLRIDAGELVALLGPSGCGKTTLLRVLAGLEIPDAGEVRYEDVDVTRVPAGARGVGFVFQHYALFKHMTVFENVAFGLRVRGVPKKQVTARVRDLLHRVRMDGFEDRAPAQLSGGQRQRVALARALASEPRVLLLDEPFGALDARVRQELRAWLRRLHDESKVTTVLVTHDRDDAFDVADRVVVTNSGRVAQEGAPADIFEQPSSVWVMRFLGEVNEIRADGPEVAYVRPSELDISREQGRFRARVRRVIAAGAQVRVELDLDDGAPADSGVDLQQSAVRAEALMAEIDERRARELDLRRGDTVFASPRRLRTFDSSAA